MFQRQRPKFHGTLEHAADDGPGAKARDPVRIRAADFGGRSATGPNGTKANHHTGHGRNHPKEDIMKASITKRTKGAIYAAQIDAAKAVQAAARDDEMTAADYAKLAAAAISGSSGTYDVIKAAAEITTNRRVQNDGICTGSENLDIWIDATLQGPNDFYIIGFYMTDVWYLDGTEGSRDYLRGHAYIRHFTEQ